MDGIGRPPGTGMRLALRTQSIEEANTASEQYEMQGFKTVILKKKQGELSIYELWIWKEGEILH